MGTIDHTKTRHFLNDIPLMELFVVLQSNDSIEIEQLTSKLNVAPTCVWIQNHEHLRLNPHIASSIATYKCYSEYVQDIDTPIIEGLRYFLPNLHDVKMLCEISSGLSFSVLLEVHPSENGYSPAYYLEPETIEILYIYKTFFSIQILDSPQLS